MTKYKYYFVIAMNEITKVCGLLASLLYVL